MGKKYRVLVIGSGGREHALAWKLSQSPLLERLYVAPGNAGTEEWNIGIAADDIAGIREFCKREKIDLVVPGPELPLTLGLADALAMDGTACFGPDKFCAQLEGSKAFAKEIMKEAGVPTAASQVFTDLKSALAWLENARLPLVIKADGLAAGKGVIIADTREEAENAMREMLEKGVFGKAGESIVVEEKLEGEEVSLLCLCDGLTAIPLASAQDHKAALDGDKGPNTGGMGAYSPAPVLPDEKLENMADVVIRPILAEMAKRGHPFRGVLYAGLMMTREGPKVLEYNVRFGDPECQPLMARMESDLLEALAAGVNGGLRGFPLLFSPRSSLGVVLAAEAYPGQYEKGMPVSGLEEAAKDAIVFHAGTKLENGAIVSSGGRVLCVTASGNTLEDAQKSAYAGIEKIKMHKSRYRKDIGAKGISRIKKASS